MRRQGEPWAAAPLPGATQAEGGSPPAHPALMHRELLGLGRGLGRGGRGKRVWGGGKTRGGCSGPWVAALGSGRGEEMLSELQERCCCGGSTPCPA